MTFFFAFQILGGGGGGPGPLGPPGHAPELLKINPTKFQVEREPI